MKKTFSKTLALLLSLMMIISIIPLTASAATYGDLTYIIEDDEITITGCDKDVKAVEIPEEIDGYPVTGIGNSAFESCKSLTSVTIPDTVTSIGVYAFDGCWALTTVKLSENVTSLFEATFKSCKSLTSIEIPAKVNYIGYAAFMGCFSLTSITVDKNNEYYSTDEYGVLYNKDKTVLVQYPVGNTRTSYVIPDTVTDISYFSFYGAQALTSVTIPDPVTSIGQWAFTGCTSLTSVTVPHKVTVIDYGAFDECESLTSITINNPECEIYDSGTSIYYEATIYGYCDSTAQAYAEKYNRSFAEIEEINEKCTHICHKDGFMSFIWKLINFFQKLFGISPVCECGATHY